MKWLFPTLLTAFVVIFRLSGIEYPVLLNFTPWIALFLCFGKELAGHIYIPIFGFLLSDIILNSYYGVQPNIMHFIFTYCAMYATCMIGKIKDIGLTEKTYVATTGFFILTSTIAWYYNPVYGSGLLAWADAVVMGDPNYPPAYLFYLKSLVGNLGFGLIYASISHYCLTFRGGSSHRVKI